MNALSAAHSGALRDSLITRIRAGGPLGLAEFMALSNDAYYAKGEAIGASGDFITAPEISQCFGELIGLWAAVVWQSMGAPEHFALVECGPGRGTLMADTLRATARVPGFSAAACVHMIERSPALIVRQRQSLAGYTVQWHDRLEDVPDGPAIVLANEFLDALPIQQFQKTATGWDERLVTVDNAGNFQFAGRSLTTPDVPAHLAARSIPGDIWESSPATEAFVGVLAKRLAHTGGAALLIDYGYERDALGDTLQAVRAHGYAPALTAPGEVDLTAHVNFAAAARAARACGTQVHGPVGQGLWLMRVGLPVRAAQLAAGKTEDVRDAIAAAVRRLTDPAAMGRLFKVMALTSAGLPTPEGFASREAV